MKLIFERSAPGRGSALIEALDVPAAPADGARRREARLPLPEISEGELSRHYTSLANAAFGVNDGFYPLGSCTMKYNPKIDEELASLPGFTGVHPSQDERSAGGCLRALSLSRKYLCEITGMDDMTFQPAAGAHGEFTAMLMVRAYHRSRGDMRRTVVLIPDSAHGTNPASAAMAGFSVKTVPSTPEGLVDLAALSGMMSGEVAALMLTNPNTVGLFDKNILEITRMVHEAGGLNYYDGANLNAIMGLARPGDMGFDLVHLNLHKTFATPHGGGGPGSGPVGCKRFLAPFLPGPNADEDGRLARGAQSIGRVRAGYGNFLVVVRALCYILSLGREGIPAAAQAAVLSANYLLSRLKEAYEPAFPGPCMHEFVLTLERMKKETGVSALDIAKGALDRGMHPPTMYFPLIVHEALMFEPTETESREALDEAAAHYLELAELARANPDALRAAPETTAVGRLDEVGAARNPVVTALQALPALPRE